MFEGERRPQNINKLAGFLEGDLTKYVIFVIIVAS